MKKLTEAFNRTSVDKGDSFEIELPVTPASGYAWDIKVLSSKVKLVGHTTVTEDEKKTKGTGGTLMQRFFFVAKECGEVEIKADLKNSNEKKSIRSCNFRIFIDNSLD